MSMHGNRAKRIATYYDQAIRRPDATKDDAVEYAVRQVFPRYSDEAQADVFAVIRESFDKYTSGITRRLDLTTRLRNYEYRRIHG